MTPAVGMLLDSKSDMAMLERCTSRLEELKIVYEIEVRSAHRDPEDVSKYVRIVCAHVRKVMICAADMAAHLAGAVAARAMLPIMGIPVAVGSLNGLGSLLSTVHIPSGVRVATIAINGVTNAAGIAAQALVLCDPDLAQNLERSGL